MPRHPFHEVALVGAYHTRQAKVLEGVRELDLVLDAVRGALAAAHLRPADVDGSVKAVSVEGASSGQADYKIKAGK